MEWLYSLFDSTGFVPRRICGDWTQSLIMVHNVSDTLIWLAYLAIPAVLIYFVRQRRDMPFPAMFWLFGIFIVSCGFTHLIEVVLFYDPVYRLAGAVKAITAVASWVTIAALIPTLPKALAMRSPEELQREIRERQRAEQQFRALLESAPDAMVIVDNHGRINMVNGQVEQLFAYLRTEMVGKPVELLVPEGLRERHVAHRERYMLQPSVRTMGAGIELNGRRKDGSQFPVEISLSPIHVEEGTLVCAAIRDITDRKEAERATREMEQRLQLMIASVKDYAIVMLDPEGCIINWNSGAERINGYRREEIMGQHFSCFYPDESDVASRAERELEAARTQGRFEEEGWRVRKDRTRFWANVVLTPVYSESGSLRGYAKVTRDMTDRKQAEQDLKLKSEELARSNAELERFAYVASHDLQEPLRMVSSYCQLIKKRYHDHLDKDADEFIDFAVDGAKRMSALINGLLDYSRMTRREQKLTELNSKEVVDDVVQDLQALVIETNAKVTCRDLPLIQADRAQLAQVFQNLIGNAIKFHGDRPPEVEISARQTDGYWEFAVHDNGIGVDPKYFERLFQIFQRLHADRFPGTGIGLALCKGIVERHGGKIWVESKDGCGSTFLFTLPVHNN